MTPPARTRPTPELAGHPAPHGARAGDPASTEHPWRRATLVLACPECGSPAGALCVAAGNRRRRRFHLVRYELARQLAGEPIRRTLSQVAPS